MPGTPDPPPPDRSLARSLPMILRAGPRSRIHDWTVVVTALLVIARHHSRSRSIIAVKVTSTANNISTGGN